MPWSNFLSDKNTVAGAILLATAAAIIKFVLDYRSQVAGTRLQRLQNQIELFYGPLFSIVDRLDICFWVEDAILTSGQLNPASKESFERFMFEQYYFPLHQQIQDILKSKLYLLKGLDIPETFSEYLRHSIQYEIQLRLWFESGISTDRTKGIPYPEQFNNDIRNGLRAVMNKIGENISKSSGGGT